MKKFVLILSASLFLFSCSKKKETDRDKIGLFGKVQKLVERTYRAEVSADGTWETRDVMSTNEFFYNEEGYVTEWIYEVPTYRYVEHYQYDAKGNPVSVFISNPGDTTTSHCKIKLNDNGLITEESWFDRDGELEFRYVNEYNDKDQVIETKAYDERDSLKTVRKFTYNEKGLQDTVFSYSAEGELQQYSSKEFEGKWLKSSNSYIPGLQLENDLGIINSSEFIEKDKEGNWVRAQMTTVNKYKKDTVNRIIDRDVIYYID